MNQTVDIAEIEKFSRIGEEWWDKNGKLRLLHETNHLRTEYIRKFLYNKKANTILDIGCGGGILSESISKYGYKVTGIDPSQENIRIAQSHAKELKINYIHSDLENFTFIKKQTFDVILCMEVIEHVTSIDLFIEKSIALLNKGGLICLSSINRTTKSYLQAIVIAEYLFKWLPKKTHAWKKFISPNELQRIFHVNGTQIKQLDGIKYNPIHGDWLLSRDTAVNYILFGQKIN